MEGKVFELIEKERQRQHKTVELIASENFVSENVQRAMGSCLTNKYAEGRPGQRYYGGCEVVDELEEYCQEQWKAVFNTGYHVNVQPHSGTQANMAAYSALLFPHDTVLAMSLENGGHLSHGSPVNFSGELYNFIFYGVDESGFIDYEDLERKAERYRPKLIVAGASAYSRIIDFARIKKISENFGAMFMVDMAHIAGLVAAGEHPSPFGLADVVTTTTHKTLRGPRGGLIFCTPELKKAVDLAVFPGVQGGPLEHVIAAKAVAAEEALRPEYKNYIQAVVRNSCAMCEEFKSLGYDIVTGGTDNHLFLIDFRRTHPELTGLKAQQILEEHGIAVNRNAVPGDMRKPYLSSGVRIGTAAETTRGHREEAFILWAQAIDKLLRLA